MNYFRDCHSCGASLNMPTTSPCVFCGYLLPPAPKMDARSVQMRHLLDLFPFAPNLIARRINSMENAMPDNEDKPLTRDDAHREVIEFLKDNDIAIRGAETVAELAEMWQAAFDAGQEALARSNLLREQQRTPRHHSMKGLPAPIGEEIARLLGRQDPPVHLNIAAMMMLLANTIDAYGRHLAMDV